MNHGIGYLSHYWPSEILGVMSDPLERAALRAARLADRNRQKYEEGDAGRTDLMLG